jgi:YhcH/YjgK/YiaL family protein
MVLGDLNQAERWEKLIPGFAVAFAFLRRKDLGHLANGRHEIASPRLYAMVMHEPGRGRSKAKLEAHRRYIDIQYSVTNSDLIGWKSTAACFQPEQPYNEEKDVQKFLDAPECWVAIAPGNFGIFFPEDAHAPLGGEELVHKVVVKVPVDWA